MSHFTKGKVAICILLFAIICIGVTTAAIIVENKNTTQENTIGEENVNNTLQNTQTSEEPEKQNIQPDGLGIKTLTDMYNLNSLKIEEETYHEGEIIQMTEWYSTYPLVVNYAQISGLNDKTVQDKINKEIKEAAFSIIDRDEQSNPEIEYVTISAICEANFSNVLSITVSKIITPVDYNDYDKYSSNESVYLNYNLETGEKITFSDMFTNTAGTKSIISQSAYTTFAEEYFYYHENYDVPTTDMDKIDYSEIENRVFKILVNYDRNNDYKFYFNERYIFVEIENEIVKIKMRDFYDQIAIYNRYANVSNLYEEEFEQSLLVFSTNKYDFLRRVEEINGNLFIDIKAGKSDDISEENEKVIEFTNKIEEKIAECMIYAQKNPDKAILLSITGIINKDYTTGEIYTSIDEYKATMDKSYYETTAKNYILDIAQGNTVEQPYYGNYYFFQEDEPVEIVDEHYDMP